LGNRRNRETRRVCRTNRLRTDPIPTRRLSQFVTVSRERPTPDLHVCSRSRFLSTNVIVDFPIDRDDAQQLRTRNAECEPVNTHQSGHRFFFDNINRARVTNRLSAPRRARFEILERGTYISLIVSTSCDRRFRFDGVNAFVGGRIKVPSIHTTSVIEAYRCRFRRAAYIYSGRVRLGNGRRVNSTAELAADVAASPRDLRLSPQFYPSNAPSPQRRIVKCQKQGTQYILRT